MIDIIAGIVLPIILFWVGSIEVRMRRLDERLREAPSRKEVSEEIRVRQESLKVLQQEIKEDIKLLRFDVQKLFSKL